MNSKKSTQPRLTLIQNPQHDLSSYCIGAIGRLVELHAVFYHERCGYDGNFEIFVAREIADFMANFDAGHDGLWLYKEGGSILGSIAIDGSNRFTEGARLRFLILDPSCRGKGIGQMMMRTALTFCQARFMNKVFLWTTPALIEARRLYEKFGFELVKEVPYEGWGTETLHQRFELVLPS
jgi:GNAT superfamily N-acetyltransferase